MMIREPDPRARPTLSRGTVTLGAKSSHDYVIALRSDSVNR